MSKIKKFKAKIEVTTMGSGGGMYITIPYDVEKAYGKKRVKIKATIDGEPYQGSLVRMGSPDHILIIRKYIREKLGKGAGDEVNITIQEDLEPRVVKVPTDFAEMLKKEPVIQTFFEQLSYTHQKEYVEWIEGAKKAETRTRRMDKAMEMMKAGKKGR